MKLSSYIIIFYLLCSISLRAEVESDNTDFLAKEKENTLKILNYKSILEARKKADDERKRKEAEIKRQKEEGFNRKRKQQLEKIEEEKRIKEEEERRRAEVERLKEEQCQNF